MAGSGVTLGFLKFVLGFDSLALEEGAGVAQKRLKKAQKDLQKTADKFVNIGSALSLGLTAPLTAFAAKGIAEARETASAMAQVDAAIKSMGNAAGLSSAQLVAMADKLELSSLYEGDEILRQVTANLLTFGNVAGDNFGRAQQAAVDLSTRMGTDLQASTLLVGKALNDPIKGLTALGRAGIQFTAQQKEQIKAFVASGNAAKAQAMILGELERQFGGAAQAAQNVDPFNKANDAFNQMAEKVGTALLPLIPPLTEAIVSLIEKFTSLSPETQKWLIIAGGVAAVLGPIALGVGGLVSGLGTLLPLLMKIGPAFALVRAAVFALTPAIWSAVSALAAMALTPVGAVITAIAVAVGAVYLAWKNWDRILPILQNLVNAAKKWLGENLRGILLAVLNPIEAVRKGFFKLYDAVVGHSYIPDMVDQIGVHMRRLDAEMVQPAKSATEKTAALVRDLQALLARLYPEAGANNQFLADLATLDAALKAGKISADQYADSLSRLKTEGMESEFDGGLSKYLNGNIWDEASPIGKADPTAELEDLLDRLPEVETKVKVSTGQIALNFARMAENIVGSLQRMSDAFKHGSFWDKVLGVLGVVQAGVEAYMGMKGGGTSGSFGGFGGFGGFRATGGPTVPGKSYIVGENGPEWFTPGSRGYVFPSANDNAGRGIAEIRPSPLFDVYIDGKIVRRAAPMAGQAAVKGSSLAQRAIANRQARQIP